MKKENIILLISFIIVIIIMTTAKPIKKALSRGYRNKNPGNIRKTPEFWKGEITGNDKDFKTFQSMEYGYRAIFVLLRTYISRGENTIEKIISRYAPPNENATNAYINTVASMSGIPKNEILSFNNKEKLMKVVEAISYVENGIAANVSEIQKGLTLLTA